jgi:hypothetical protein
MESENHKNSNSHEKKRNDKICTTSNKIISRKKVFYRDKMISLMNEQEMLQKNEYNYGDYTQSARGKIPLSRDEQLRRNR